MERKTKNKTVKIRYIGRRLWGASVTHVFLQGKKERGWNGIRGCTIGYYYEAERDGDKLKLSKRPHRVGSPNYDFDSPDRKLCEQWEAQDHAAMMIVAEKRAEARLKRETPLRKKLDELKPLIKKLSFIEKKAFANYIMDLE